MTRGNESKHFAEVVKQTRVIVTHYGRLDALQISHSMAEASEAGIVLRGFDGSIQPASRGKNQAADRAAISSCQGKRRTRVAWEGRCDRQDRASAQYNCL